MNVETIKFDFKQGNVNEEYIGFLKYTFINQVLRGESQKVTNALMAYAHFLNREGINSDNYPLYLIILESNNRYAIDQLLEDHEPEKYLDVVEPNTFIVKSIFRIFDRYRRNEIYGTTLRVLFGYLMKVYESAQEGYQVFPPSIPDVNNLGKILDESRDQDDPLNRDILDILMYVSDLDAHYENDPVKKEIARQAGRIRSDYFDNRRRLSQSITEVMLENAERVYQGVPPQYTYTG